MLKIFTNVKFIESANILGGLLYTTMFVQRSCEEGRIPKDKPYMLENSIGSLRQNVKEEMFF